MLTSPPDAGSRPRTMAPPARPFPRPSQAGPRPAVRQTSVFGQDQSEPDDAFATEYSDQAGQSFFADWRHERSIRRSLRFANKTMPESLRPPSARRGANAGVTTFRTVRPEPTSRPGRAVASSRPSTRPGAARTAQTTGVSVTPARSVSTVSGSVAREVRSTPSTRSSVASAASAESTTTGRRPGASSSGRPTAMPTSGELLTQGNLALAAPPQPSERANRSASSTSSNAAPRPTLRAVERPVTSVLRSKGIRRLMVLMLLIGGFAIAAASIVMHATLARNQLELDLQRKEVAVAEQQNLQLRATVAELEAPYRIVSVAESLGLQQPYDIQYVVAKTTGK